MNKCIYKNRLGKTGEIIAKDYLMEKGHRFIANNYRYERSEIDMIFCDDPKKLLMFIEVKTRRNRKFGEPEESINSAKQSSIKKAVEGFMLENSAYEGFDMRIDVISIFIDSSGSEVNHIENAF